MNFKENLINKLEEIEINIDDKIAEDFKKYMELLLEWNEKINLTAITQEEDIILKHFVDSLTVNKYINDGASLIDVGTGAGFPGVPLAIVNKNIKITLMDSLNKRIKFLNDVIEKVKLDKINTIHARAEELARNNQYREKYDVTVSRAVANLSTLVEYMLPFAKVGGRCICMKGANIKEELLEASKAINELGGSIIEVDKFKLANSNYERNIIVIEKVKNTKNKYPRKAGIPSKEPIR